MNTKATILLTALATLVIAGSAAAQAVQVLENDEWCERHRYHDDDDDRVRLCEVREMTLTADRSLIKVDGRANGGIKVEGWDRNEIQLRAKVQATAESESDARAMLQEVELGLGSTIRASGPSTQRNEWWVVSYELRVPRSANLDLHTTNGGISIADVSGDIDFRATNGGIHLDGLSGDVRGRTTNGGLHIDLTGREWAGQGLDVETTNGGVKLSVPENYSAILESGTVNGSMTIDFPITVQGRIDRRQISAELGSGGKTIRAVTTNGSVSIRRS